MKKNTIKRALATAAAFLLAVTIGGGTALTVKADNTATITVHPAASEGSNPTYTAYKIFDATKSESNSSTSQSEKDGTITDVSGNVAYTGSRYDGWMSQLFTFDTNGVATPASGQTWVTAVKQGDSNTYTISKTAALTSDTAAEFANFLSSHISSQNGTQLTKQEDGTYKVTGLATGYYLITSSVGSSVILATTNVDMYEKNNYPSLEKNQSKTQNGTYGTSDVDAAIGDKVYYHVDVTIPATADKAITITDVMSKGLTLKDTRATSSDPAQTATWSAKTTSGGTDTTISDVDLSTLPAEWTEDAAYTATDGEKKYTIEVPDTIVKALANKANATTTVTLTVSYVAQVNENAVVAPNTNDNKASLTYDNFTTEEKTVKAKTYDFNLTKNFEGADTGADLTATFVLRKDTDATNAARLRLHDVDNSHTNYIVDTSDTVYEPQFTVKHGTTVNIKGLAKGTYYLVETATADGYNKLEKSIKVEVTDNGVIFTDNNAATPTATTVAYSPTTTVTNKAGTVLPSTGGIGTTIFYVAGGILIIGAVVLLISRKKASTNN